MSYRRNTVSEPRGSNDSEDEESESGASDETDDEEMEAFEDARDYKAEEESDYLAKGSSSKPWLDEQGDNREDLETRSQRASIISSLIRNRRVNSKGNTVSIEPWGVVYYINNTREGLKVGPDQIDFEAVTKPMSISREYYEGELDFISRYNIASIVIQGQGPSVLIPDDLLSQMRLTIAYTTLWQSANEEDSEWIQEWMVERYGSSMSWFIRKEGLPSLFSENFRTLISVDSVLTAYNTLDSTRSAMFCSKVRYPSVRKIIDECDRLKSLRLGELEDCSKFLEKACQPLDYKYAVELTPLIPEATLSSFRSIIGNGKDSAYVKYAQQMPRSGSYKTQMSSETQSALSEMVKEQLKLPENDVVYSDTVMLTLGEFCVYHHLSELIDSKQSPKVIDASRNIQVSMSKESKSYFEVSSLKDKILPEIKNCLLDLGIKETNEMRLHMSQIITSKESETELECLSYFKGYIFERLQCHERGLEYYPEQQKRTFEEILELEYGNELKQEMCECESSADNMLFKPDAYEILNPGRIDISRMFSDMEYSVRTAGDCLDSEATLADSLRGVIGENLRRGVTNLISMNEGSEEADDTVSVTSTEGRVKDLHSKVQQNLQDFINSDMQDSKVLVLYEFGWVRNARGKELKHQQMWAGVIYTMWLFNIPVFLKSIVLTNSDEYWRGSDLKYKIMKDIAILYDCISRSTERMEDFNYRSVMADKHKNYSMTKKDLNIFSKFDKQIKEELTNIKSEICEEEVLPSNTADKLYSSIKGSQSRRESERKLIENPHTREQGVKFLTQLVTTMSRGSETRPLSNDSMASFETTFDKEFKESNKEEKDNLRGIISSVLINGSLTDSLVHHDPETLKTTALDRMLTLALPSTTGPEKSMKDKFQVLCRVVALRYGVKVMALRDGSIISVENMLKKGFRSDCENLIDSGDRLKEAIDKSFIRMSEVSKAQILTYLTECLKELEEPVIPVPYCKRGDDIFSELKDQTSGILEGIDCSYKRDLESRTKPVYMENGVLRISQVSGNMPTEDFCLKTVEDIHDSIKFCNENSETVASLICDEKIREIMSTSGHTDLEHTVFDRALRILSKIRYFQNLVLLSEISTVFIKLCSRKRGSLLKEERVRGTNLRLFVKKQRNSLEGIKTMIISDDGKFKKRFIQNEKTAKLYAFLPQTVLSLFVMISQEELVTLGELDSSKFSSIERFLQQAVEGSLSGTKTCVEDLYGGANFSAIYDRGPKVSNFGLQKLCSDLVGLLLNTTFRTSVTKENNTVASLSRYALMMAISTYGDPKGMAKKVAEKCVSVLDTIEVACVRYMFKHRLSKSQGESLDYPPCYSIGYQSPKNHDEAVRCMYYHHVYNKELGPRSQANNKANASYLESELKTRVSLGAGAFSYKKLTGELGLMKYFNQWLEVQGEDNIDYDNKRREIVELAADKMDSHIRGGTDTVLFSRFVTLLAAVCHRETIGPSTFDTMRTSKLIKKPLTAICEPNSVLKSFQKSGDPVKMVRSIIKDKDKKASNNLTKYAKERSKDADCSYGDIDEMLKNSPALREIAETIQREMKSYNSINIKDFMENIECTKLENLCDFKGEQLLRFHKQVVKKVIREIRNDRDSKGVTKSENKDEDSESFGKMKADLISYIVEDDIEGLELTVEDLEKLDRIEDLCEEALELFRSIRKYSIDVKGVDRVDLRHRLKEVEKKISVGCKLLTKLYLRLICRSTRTRLFLYEWSKGKNNKSANIVTIPKDKESLGNFLSKRHKNTEMYVIRVGFMSDLLSKVSAEVDFGESQRLSSLEQILSHMDMIIKGCGDEFILAHFVHTSCIGFLKPPSKAVSSFVRDADASFRSPRSTSLEMMGEFLRTYNRTDVLSVANSILKEGVEYTFGSAPKAQFMGNRELCILEMRMKIVMACVESISGHILDSTETDLLETPGEKERTLSDLRVSMKQQREGLIHLSCTSGDRSKWGPKHNYNHFRSFFDIFLRGTPVKDMYTLVMLKGMVKKLEIPVSAIRSVINFLLNMTAEKCQDEVTISNRFKKLFDLVSSVPSAMWNNYQKPDADSGFKLSELSDSYYMQESSIRKFGQPPTYDMVENMMRTEVEDGLKFDWCDYLDRHPLYMVFGLLSSGMPSIALMSLQRLSKGKLYHSLISHMNQGIPHRTSSIIHNATMDLSVRCFEKYLISMRCDPSNYTVKYVTSSDDYFYYITAPGSVSKKTFRVMIEAFERIQNRISSLMNIKNSPKSVTGNIVGEVYSVFETGSEPVHPLIKLIGQFQLPGSQLTVLDYNLEELTKCYQLVDNSATACTLYAYLLCKNSKLKSYLNINNSMFRVIKNCSGTVNPFLTPSWLSCMRDDVSMTLLTKTWQNNDSFADLISLEEENSVDSLRQLSESMKYDTSKTEEESVDSLAGYIMDGLILQPRETEKSSVTCITRLRDTTSLPNPIALPPSTKRNSTNVKLKNAIPVSSSDKTEITTVLARCSRGGTTSIRAVEEARIKQSLTAPKLEIKLSRAYENSGLNLMSSCFRTHCLRVRKDSSIAKEITSFLDIKSGKKGDPGSDRESHRLSDYKKFKISDVTSYCKMIATVVYHFDVIVKSTEDIDKSSVITQDMLKLIYQKITERKLAELKSLVSSLSDTRDSSIRSAQNSYRERLSSTDSIDSEEVYGSAADTDSSESEDDTVEMLRIDSPKKMRGERQTDAFTRAVLKESSVSERVREEERPESLIYDRAAIEYIHLMTEVSPKLTSGLSVSIIYELLRNTKVYSGEFCSSLPSGDMRYNRENSVVKVMSVRKATPGEGLVSGNRHYKQTSWDKLENNWAVVCVNILHSDIVSELQLVYDNYSALSVDKIKMMQRLGPCPSSDAEKGEYFAMAEAAFSTAGMTTRVSYIRGLKAEEGVYGKEISSKLRYNICVGYIAEVDMSEGSSVPMDDEAHKKCCTFASMVSKMSLTGRNLDLFDNCLRSFLNNYKLRDDLSLYQLQQLHSSKSAKRGALRTITALMGIANMTRQNSDKEDVLSIKFCRKNILSSKSLVLTEGKNTLTYLEDSNCLISSTQDLNSITFLLTELISEEFGISQLKGDADLVTLRSKFSKQVSKETEELEYIRIKVENGQLKRALSDHSPHDFIVFIDRIQRKVRQGYERNSVTVRSVSSSDQRLCIENRFVSVSYSPLARKLAEEEIKLLLSEDAPDHEAVENTMKDIILSYDTQVVRCEKQCSLVDIIKIVLSCGFSWPSDSNEVNSRRLISGLYVDQFGEVLKQGVRKKLSENSLRADHKSVTAFYKECLSVMNNPTTQGLSCLTVPSSIASKVTGFVCDVAVLHTKGFKKNEELLRMRKSQAMRSMGEKEVRPVIMLLKKCISWSKEVISESECFYRYLTILGLSVNPTVTNSEILLRAYRSYFAKSSGILYEMNDTEEDGSAYRIRKETGEVVLNDSERMTCWSQLDVYAKVCKSMMVDISNFDALFSKRGDRSNSEEERVDSDETYPVELLNQHCPFLLKGPNVGAAKSLYIRSQLDQRLKICWSLYTACSKSSESIKSGSSIIHKYLTITSPETGKVYLGDQSELQWVSTCKGALSALRVYIEGSHPITIPESFNSGDSNMSSSDIKLNGTRIRLPRQCAVTVALDLCCEDLMTESQSPTTGLTTLIESKDLVSSTMGYFLSKSCFHLKVFASTVERFRENIEKYLKTGEKSGPLEDKTDYECTTLRTILSRAVKIKEIQKTALGKKLVSATVCNSIRLRRDRPISKVLIPIDQSKKESKKSTKNSLTIHDYSISRNWNPRDVPVELDNKDRLFTKHSGLNSEEALALIDFGKITSSRGGPHNSWSTLPQTTQEFAVKHNLRKSMKDTAFITFKTEGEERAAEELMDSGLERDDVETKILAMRQASAIIINREDAVETLDRENLASDLISSMFD